MSFRSWRPAHASRGLNSQQQPGAGQEEDDGLQIGYQQDATRLEFIRRHEERAQQASQSRQQSATAGGRQRASRAVAVPSSRPAVDTTAPSSPTHVHAALQSEAMRWQPSDIHQILDLVLQPIQAEGQDTAGPDQQGVQGVSNPPPGTTPPLALTSRGSGHVSGSSQDAAAINSQQRGSMPASQGTQSQGDDVLVPYDSGGTSQSPGAGPRAGLPYNQGGSQLGDSSQLPGSSSQLPGSSSRCPWKQYTNGATTPGGGGETKKRPHTSSGKRSRPGQGSAAPVTSSIKKPRKMTSPRQPASQHTPAPPATTSIQAGQGQLGGISTRGAQASQQGHALAHNPLALLLPGKSSTSAPAPHQGHQPLHAPVHMSPAVRPAATPPHQHQPTVPAHRTTARAATQPQVPAPVSLKELLASRSGAGGRQQQQQQEQQEQQGLQRHWQQGQAGPTGPSTAVKHKRRGIYALLCDSDEEQEHEGPQGPGEMHHHVTVTPPHDASCHHRYEPVDQVGRVEQGWSGAQHVSSHYLGQQQQVQQQVQVQQVHAHGADGTPGQYRGPAASGCPAGPVRRADERQGAVDRSHDLGTHVAVTPHGRPGSSRATLQQPLSTPAASPAVVLPASSVETPLSGAALLKMQRDTQASFLAASLSTPATAPRSVASGASIWGAAGGGGNARAGGRGRPAAGLQGALKRALAAVAAHQDALSAAAAGHTPPGGAAAEAGVLRCRVVEGPVQEGHVAASLKLLVDCPALQPAPVWLILSAASPAAVQVAPGARFVVRPPWKRVAVEEHGTQHIVVLALIAE